MCRPQSLPREGSSMMSATDFSSRVQRSRNWKEGTNSENYPPTPSIATKKPNQNRRRRRPNPKTNPTKSIPNDDVSTASTASTMPSSDDSLSSSDSCSTPQRKRIQNERTRGRASPTKSKKKSWKKTAKKINVVEITEISEKDKARYVALDAEMVGVGPGGYDSVLARVSLVNWEGEAIFDAHVKVTEPVTDYRTFVSGITAEDLESEDAISFSECQHKVLSLLQGKILVGHGLKNDFSVLGFSHPWHAIRDTAKYEPFMKSDPEDAGALLPKKLKVLAKDKLGMIIQEEGKSHCPVEDAMAAMELYKKHRGKWERSVEWKMERTKQIMGQ